MNELITDCAYAAIRESPLLDAIDNSEWDAKTIELAGAIQKAVDEWLAGQYAAILSDYSEAVCK